jgi:dihydroxyacetone kinase-like protein
MKKLINDPNDVVPRHCVASRRHTPSSRSTTSTRSSTAVTPQAGKVGIVSGGGSGHEPLHGGFVGLGMLDAACAGEMFTSPVPEQMLAATKLVDGGAGVLHVVKNYTGDVMNFEMAAELAAAETGARWCPWSPTTTSPCRTAPGPRAARGRRHRAAREDRRRGGGAGP